MKILKDNPLQWIVMLLLQKCKVFVQLVSQCHFKTSSTKNILSDVTCCAIAKIVVTKTECVTQVAQWLLKVRQILVLSTQHVSLILTVAKYVIIIMQSFVQQNTTAHQVV